MTCKEPVIVHKTLHQIILLSPVYALYGDVLPKWMIFLQQIPKHGSHFQEKIPKHGSVLSD